MTLPNVADVMAINYKPTSKASVEAISGELLQIRLEEVLIEGSNQYHERFIFLEGMLKDCQIERMYGDPSLGTPTYDTRLLETDTSDFGVEGTDASGFTFGSLRNLFTMTRRGGYSTLFKGRMVRGYAQTLRSEASRVTPAFELVNSVGATVDDVSNEGGGAQPQVKMSGCSSVVLRQVGIGSPVDHGQGYGNGLEMVGCRDCVVDTVWSRSGISSFSEHGRKFLTVDTTSRRNRFNNVTLRGHYADEVATAAEAGTKGTFYDIVHDEATEL
jgi:hypothetical protein